jgi:outer membrane receptor protein involved in Fe transport
VTAHVRPRHLTIHLLERALFPLPRLIVYPAVQPTTYTRSFAPSWPSAALALLALSFLARALPAATPAAPNKPVVLSPFEVRNTQDYGYRIGAAITGTGTDGLIKETPLNISIVSQELIADQVGNQLVDVLRSASATSAQVKDEFMILIRGYMGPQFVNGLPAGQGLALYDVDRIEVVKGPNAVFAGISNPGGTVNLIKVKPSFIPRHSLDLSVGSYEHQRLVLRSSAPLFTDKLAYSLVYGHTDEKSSIDNMFTRDQYYSGGLTWRPLPRLTFHARYGYLDREAGRRPHTVVSHPLYQQRDREAIEQFDRLGLPRPATYPQLENGAVRTPAGVPIVTGRTAPEGVDAFIARTLGPNVPPYPGVYSRDFFPNDAFNYNGDDGRDSYQNKNTAAEAEWIASPTFAVHALFQQVDSHRMRREFNGLRPVAGQRLRSTISDFKPGGITFSAKLEGVYKLYLSSAGNHDFLGGFQHDGAKDVISPVTVATSRVITYNPRTDPKPQLLALLRDQYGASYHEPGVVRKGGGHSNAFYGILQSSFFSDRLRTLVGGRSIANHRPTDDNRDGRDEDFTIRKLLPHYAALFRLTPELSIYGSQSRSFLPQRQQTADLDAIRATQGDPTSPTYRPPASVPVKFLSADLLGRGWETGAKLDLGDGKLVGTASYFSNEEANRLDVDTANQVLYQLPGATVRTAAGKTRTQGVESEWVWTPLPHYQALLGASYFFKKNEVSNPSDAREVGSHLESVPRFTFTFWNKYTFSSGALRGLYVGGGANVMGETYMHPSWTVPIKSDAVTLFDAMVGYTTKLQNTPVNLRLNARNLADKHYLNGTFQYGEPRTIIFTVGLQF